MDRRLLALAAGLLLAALVPGSALAVNPANLDQHQDSTPDWGGGVTEGQTFTVGTTGQLTDVGLALAMNGTETVNVSIQTLNGSSQPSGTILATGSASVTGSDKYAAGWVYFTLSSPISVVAGEHYAIVFSTTNSQFFGAFGSTDTYAGGQEWFVQSSAWTDHGYTTYDLAFRTYVQAAAATPAPTSRATATPPPTSTGAAADAGASPYPMAPLPIGLLAVLGCALAIAFRRGRTA